MLENDLDTRSKIVSVAVEMIGKERNVNVTIRDIAGRANVNLASINYYFRSKENLLFEVEQFFLRENELIHEVLFDVSKAPRDRINVWVNLMMEHLLAYPGIIFMMAMKIIHDNQEKAGLLQLMDRPQEGLALLIKELSGEENDQVIAFKVMQLLSGVINPVLLYYGLGKAFQADIGDQKFREGYIKQLVESVIK